MDKKGLQKAEEIRTAKLLKEKKKMIAYIQLKEQEIAKLKVKLFDMERKNVMLTERSHALAEDNLVLQSQLDDILGE